MQVRSCFTIAVFCLVAATAHAIDVDTDVSTRETYVGLPVVLQIHIRNAAQTETPEMPEVDGLVIESAGPPSRSSRISIVNGRRSQQTTVTYSFRVTPQREGSFTIPPIKILSDGYATISKAIRVVASKSDTDDLLFAEIEGRDNEIYVGEALDVTLKIWIRPYRDREFQVSLGEGDMWSLIAAQSSWGIFEESHQRMAQDRKRPRGTSVLREDSEGNEHEYFLYEIDATVYPDRPGQIDGDDVRIIVNYPVQLGRSRSPLSMFDDDDFFGGSGLFDDSIFRGFGSRLGIKKARPIVAEASVDPIIVKPIPQQGRPDNYRGAVGKYTIVTEAKPAKVKVGDLITLHIGVDGTGPMDVVRAPPLASQQSLIRDFKVPDEPLAGFVDRSRKIFSTTIRPLHDGVTEIPPVSMSYFDPETEKFVTTSSDPIPIQVEPADELALDAIVGEQRPAVRAPSGKPSSPKEPEAELALFTGPELLRSVDRPSLVSSRLIGILVFPPLITLAVVAFASRHAVSGRVSARRQFRKALTLAQSPTEIAEALEHFLTRQFRLDQSRLTRDQTIGQLRASGHHDLAIRVERLYANSDKPMSGTRIEHSSLLLRDEAMRIVEDLGRTTRRGRSGQRPRKLSSSAGLLLIAVVTINHSASAESGPGAEPDPNVATLSADQQRVVLDEAVSIYAAAESDNADSKERFARSASKFQLLVDSGIRNDRLYCNLAGTQLQAGQTGRAIANYRRALRLAPFNGRYREYLALAERSIQNPNTLSPGVASIRAMNDMLLRFVRPHVMQGLFISAWAAVWCILILRLLRFQFHWKSAALLTFLCAALTAGSYFFRVSEFVRDDMAVLVEPTVSLREGDGTEFAEIRQLSDADGRVVRVLDHRGDWIRIGLDGGRDGWIAADASEEI